ncbi:PREDICTED: dihydroxyacetone phosphate acyltransferase [Ceratosolen solmsi marchali]|uniref:Dihydroxyacetone phosphate acyltransferase n=1 Tax=Ceratosolen solmsi marchali TaxID=326594 RepID=A0AAJ6YIV0_9HYME|nr:PREDICTED: dihydroxyacetone phosphate acyltransferase [Ceratosolen solmsi marchali]
MQQLAEEKFVNLLDERRKDCDIVWVSRSMTPLAPHKLPSELVYTRKQALNAALSDPKVLGIVSVVAKSRGIPASTVLAEAKTMLQEMASKAHMPTVRWLGLIITKVMKRILISIKLNESYIYRIKNQMCASSIQYVYTPTHRSYLDFILLSYILFSYDMALPNIASGMDFYQMRIVGELLRQTGAFYMRRSFASDPLYKEIFRAYVGSLVAHSNRAIEFFIEGTRSRSQKTLLPKFGLLSTMLEVQLQSKVIDIQFIPISISYDKPLEELLFVYELLGVPKPVESTTGLFQSLSILREPMSHGHVYLNIAPPISARDYVDMEIRKACSLSPNAKLPIQIVKNVAYAIINCHKRNTILTPFNLISLLYNERMYSHPNDCYSLDDLLRDYKWLKKIFVEKFEVSVNPVVSRNSKANSETHDDLEKQEVFESLQTHKNLMELNSEQKLKLKPRHNNVTQLKNVRGFLLKQETLNIAVPAVNLMIYVNPVFAHLAKPAIAALCINRSSRENAAKRYLLLRSLFSIEFALVPDLTQLELLREWEEIIEFLSKEISDIGLHSILCNLVIPFVSSLYVICKIFLEWKSSLQCVEKNILKECQRLVEELLYEEMSLINHPYSLTLDTYASLLSSLVKRENIVLDKSGVYTPNNITDLQDILVDLEDILKQSYVNVFSSFSPEEIPNLQAKL